MANQNAQNATPSNQPTVVTGLEADAPEAKNILEDVCEIESAKAENTHMIERPPLGETREVDLQNGQNYIFGFAKDDAASFIEENGTLTVTFDCGGKLVLNNYSSVVTGGDASTFAFSDVVPQGELSSLIKVVDTTKQDAVDPENTAKNVKTAKSASAQDFANIEPAAGDESTNAKKLAQIEPAAGEAAGGASGGGYGFNSSYATTPVGPLNPVGVLGATSLVYGANFREPNPLPGEDKARDPMNIGPGNEFIDETNLAGGPVVETGTINIDYGADGPGAIGPNGDFFASGSMVGGNLTSNGDAVVVTQTATGYAGIANGVTVFTLDIQSPSGEYTFTLFQPLDHADGADANDTIGLTFGVIATDGDGDPVQTSLTVVVADDAPVLDGDGTKGVDEDDLPGASVSGNLVEQFGSDGAGDIHTTGTHNASGDLAGGVLSSGGHAVVITSTPTGYVGTANGVEVFNLVITNQQTGAYTFNLLQPLDHSVGGDTITLTFGAEIVDYDGDKDPADIVIAITDDVPEIKDGNPTIGNGLEVIDETNLNGATITVNGNLPFDAGSDAPSTIKPNGNVVEGGSITAGDLTSHGVEVVITQTANGYVGTANGNPVFTFTIGDNGAYSFTLQDQLDHANGADPNDVIALRFGVKITDNDGDTDDGFVNINIVDDAPVLADDGLKIVFEKNLGPTSVNGNLVEDFGEDGPGNIHATGTHNAFGDLKNGALTSDGHPVVITSTPTGYVGTANGVEVFNLVITNQQTGTYTFTLLQPLDHGNGDGRLFIDFGVEIVDFDGDKDPATIHIKVFDDKPEINDDQPVIGKGLEVVDETNLGPIVREGKVTFDFGSDGAGEFGPNSTSGSSVPLFSNGSAVTIAGDANGYVGKTAGGDTIFTIAINADGTYKFTLIGVLDHPNGANPDDIITLNFGVQVTDADGDIDTGNITVRVHDDGPVAVDDGAFTDGNTLNGNVLTNDDAGADGLGAVTKVTFNGSTTNIAPGATVVVNGAHGVLTISSNGVYKYVPNGGTDGTDQFTYTMDDYDNDTDTAKLTIRVDNDDCPVIVKPATEVVDETNLGLIVETGHVDANYFSDGPGAITTTGVFTSGGSKLGGNLTSNGFPVNVTSTPTGYVGTANGAEVFRLTIQPNGDYAFTLSDTLDHADGANPNDVIALRFGVKATDADGDTASTVITVNVLDDAPVLTDDGLKIVFEKNLGPTSVNGNLVEDFGEDGPGNIHTTGTHTVLGDAKNGALSSGGVPVIVTSTDTGYVGKANGADVFKLVIDPLTGAYTFTLFKALDHGNGDGRLFIDFGVEIVDFDGDKDPATIHIKVFDGKPEIHDDNPTIGHGLEVVDETNLGPIVRNGAVDVDFGDDAPGTLGTSGVVTSTYPLTSHGAAIAIATTANGYTGTANGNTIFTLTINQDGTYTYTQIGVVDHANAADPNDSVTVNFGIKVTDADGDTDTGNITIRIHDDGPVAVDDNGSTDGNTLNGNVLTNDDAGADGLGAVTKVTFNGSTTNIAPGATVVVNGAHGVLTISSNGVYKYVPNGGTAGTDQFTYTMDDYDNDTDTAKLTINVDNDDCPVLVKPAVEVVDETNLGPIVENGVVQGNFFGDGPGTFKMDGNFSSAGSKLGGNLTSNGFPVNVTSTDTGYVGKANGVDVFKITINPATGAYQFTLLGVLDHANAADPNDVITLNFGVRGTDTDGDFDSTVIRVNVLDDAPIAKDDHNTQNVGVATGNVVTGLNGGAGAADDLSNDRNDNNSNAVTKITFGATTVNVPAVGQATIDGAFGQLKISSNGAYTYTPNGATGGADQFTYTLRDDDGDASTAKLFLDTAPDTCVGITVNNGGDKICIKEDGQGVVPVHATYGGGDGDEVLTLKVTGINTSWTITAPGWTNNGGGVYTLTLPAGQREYNGSFAFKPPANSDVDMGNITFTASLYDPDTNGTKVATDGVRVQVDAVVDTPVLTVQDIPAQQNWYYKNQGYQVPLSISSNATDTDGSEIVTKIVIKLNQPFTNPVPPFNTLDDMGIGLNKGTEVSPGVWEIPVNAGDTAAALMGLKLVVPDNMNYGVIHQQHVGGHKANIIVETHVQEKVVAGDGNGECDFTDNKTTVIKAISLTFAVTPLVLDLNGNGIELVAAGEHVLFDMNNNGTHDQTTWVKGSDGMLAIDANHDGVINNQSELFGNTDTVDNGFANLAQYDGNNDGKIDISDAVYADLLVWQDTNQDGISQSGEMKSLADLGIASINLNATETYKQLADGFISHESTFTYADGTTGAIVDANFNVVDGNEIDLGAALNGTEGNDAIYGTANNDVITGHAGNDILYGSGGDDVFNFDAIDGSVDTIKDFDAGDVLDLSGIVQMADAVQDSINDFVFRTEVNGNTVISVDATGSGDAAHATVIAVLEGATGLDLNQIIQIQQAA